MPVQGRPQVRVLRGTAVADAKPAVFKPERLLHPARGPLWEPLLGLGRQSFAGVGEPPIWDATVASWYSGGVL